MLKGLLDSPIACVGLKGADRLQVVNGAELREDIIDAVGNYVQEVHDSQERETVVMICGSPWQNRDFETVRLSKTRSHRSIYYQGVVARRILLSVFRNCTRRGYIYYGSCNPRGHADNMFFIKVRFVQMLTRLLSL